MNCEWMVNPSGRVRGLLWIVLCLIPFSLSGADGTRVDQPEEPLAAEEAVRRMTMPEGFQVTLFAAEPDVRQPVGFCLDDRGRLWVAEAYSYPRHTDQPAQDRILILEDETGDGRFDKRTVFYEGLNYVTGIEVGFGGVWVMSPPYFLFIPDRDGDDVPDGPPEALLDGFGNHANSHNLANGFAWGPDGWLYGTHGRTNWSLIGRPGTPDEQRERFDGGVYRYHPVHHLWERFADGTTNPWGIDWDDYGQAFVSNCVNPHLFHVIQGAHYEPWRNRESSLHAYERIATIADHLHYAGELTHTRQGTPEEDAAGGGHAHSGTMVYLGDNWPEQYRNTIFMNNIHGKRVNNDLLKRVGSGYVASHAPDILRSQDPAHMGITLAYGPDGGVYVSDWNHIGDCHSRKNTLRETGRIFKMTFGTPPRVDADVAQQSLAELVELQRHRNDWWVRHARRVLQERAQAGENMSSAQQTLRQMLDEETTTPLKLRALWALYVIGGVDQKLLADLLEDEDEHLRAWGVRLLTETIPPLSAESARTMASVDLPASATPQKARLTDPEPAESDTENFADEMPADHASPQQKDSASAGTTAEPVFYRPSLPEEFKLAEIPDPLQGSAESRLNVTVQSLKPGIEKSLWKLAAEETSPLVRLHLACAMQRLTPESAWPIAESLAMREEDQQDHNLPLLIWYGCEPLIHADLSRFVKLAAIAEIPLLRRHIARRVASLPDPAEGLAELIALLPSGSAEFRQDLLQGILRGLEGHRTFPMPAGWPESYRSLAEADDAQVGELALRLALLFDDPVALQNLRERAQDTAHSAAERQQAITALVARQAQGLAPLLLDLLQDAATCETALRGLAEFDHTETPVAILERYPQLSPSERQQALQTLASRKTWAAALLDAVEQEQIPRTDLTAFTARQLRNLGDPELVERVNEVWGEIRETSAERVKQMADYKKRLTPDQLARANPAAGRGVFVKLCANCHRLFGTGGEIGPDLTGSQRANLDYILENMIDPSASVARDYQMEILVTISGRVITGLVIAETETAVTVATVSERIVIPAAEIEERQTSPNSIMPDGLLKQLNFQEIRDLIAYLASPTQVSLKDEG